jgi:hypothetical protein
MSDTETRATAEKVPAPREAWTTPVLRALSANAAENNFGGSVPDAEGTS